MSTREWKLQLQITFLVILLIIAFLFFFGNCNDNEITTYIFFYNGNEFYSYIYHYFAHDQTQVSFIVHETRKPISSFAVIGGRRF